MPRTSILAIAGVALVLAGCGSSSSSSSSTNAAASASTAATSAPSPGPFLSNFTTVSKVASTVPANGDINPYGIVIVPTSVGKLQAGQMLISNFNAKESAKENGQGTGTTIVQVSTAGKVSPFATIDAKTLPGPCPGGVGLTTALNILPGGYVVVGSLPTTNGKTATAQVRLPDRARQRRQAGRDDRQQRTSRVHGTRPPRAKAPRRRCSSATRSTAAPRRASTRSTTRPSCGSNSNRAKGSRRRCSAKR